MASIIITSIPGHGHVTPLLAVAENFVKRGDDVRFITGALFADRVRATGATFLPLPAEADFDDTPIDELLPRTRKVEGRQGGRARHRARLRPARQAAVRHAHCRAGGPAGRRRDRRTCLPGYGVPAPSPASDAAGGGHVRGRSRCPSTAATPRPFGLGLPPARFLNRQRNSLLAKVNRRVLRQPYQVIDDLHAEVHGCPMPTTLMDWGRHADALVQFTVPSFEYPRSDAPSTLHFVGPLSATGSQAPLPAWWSDLDGSRPVVHVTQGTVANTDYDQVIAPTLRALADEDVLVVVATGNRPLDSAAPAARERPRGDVPAVRRIAAAHFGLRHQRRLRRRPVRVALRRPDRCHRRQGGQAGSRRPRRVVRRRAAHQKRHPSPRALRRDILAVLNEPRYRQASRRVAADLAAAPASPALPTSSTGWPWAIPRFRSTTRHASTDRAASLATH